MAWTQIYDPLESGCLSTLVAALPIVALLGGLGLLRWPAPRAAAVGLAVALGVAIGAYGMPWPTALASAGYGACFGLFPIGWIVLAAVFLYALTVETGEFEKVKYSITILSADRRIQAILIAFSFGAFLEGAAGFGAPVAITAALMIGAGFHPLHAASLALIANTAPVAFGSLGTPITTLSQVTGLSEMTISQMAGRQLPFFSLIIPAWMVVVMSGWRGLKGVWPAVLVSGGTFASVQALTANLVGPTLVDVAGGIASLLATVTLLKVWQPAELWQFGDDGREIGAPEPCHPALPCYRRRELASAWVPWLVLSFCMLLWGMPAVRTFLNGGLSPAALAARAADSKAALLGWWERPNWLAGSSELRLEIPRLHGVVYRNVPAVTRREKPEEAVFRFNWLSATGTGGLVAAVLSAFWMQVGLRRFLRVWRATLYRLRWSLFTIAAMLAIAYTSRYSGSDVTLGLAFTHTGVLYPFFAALLGWMGVALTGSDTSSNALFGSLQKVTAEQLGLSPVLIATANSTGGVMGKMIDAQSIVVSAAATNQPGSEAQILRAVFWHSLALATLMGLLTLAQAYWLRGMVP